ncbi:MAG TPA: D-aminoacyl-tRNA deacylase [Oscillospiraceae bacterium]|nr:D-aminoacyl-tRNA deacylase [Oscillospiraceae bacterium]HXK78407.1 D-aminoacyl-tRNA deacylase [Oscillospiraceae bacterium]
MIALLQRCREASVECGGELVSQIGEGFLILLGVAKGDTEQEADLLAKKTAELRIFEDENGKMNRSVLETGGSALVVSNFTLCADCSHGRRPSFFDAMLPQQANELYEYFIKKLQYYGIGEVKNGVFGGDMQVRIQNDGPVTISLDTADLK